MLEQLLNILHQGGSHTVAGLAQKLGTSPTMVEVMLEDLTRRGYLQTIGDRCTSECEHCPFGSGCTVAGAKQVWSLTGKG